MLLRLGKKYSAFVSRDCLGQDAAHWKAALSRRGFLAASGAIAGATPLILTGGSAAAQEADTSGMRLSPELMERITTSIDQDGTRLVEIFKDIHRNPELGFMETRTAEIVARELGALGYEVKTGIGVTGVVGILRNGDGPTVMYRADMDANAVEEATGLDYASTVRVTRPDGAEVPVAHMCGHDAHVTWMLGVAKVMSETTDEWSGTLIFVGQPAEEPITGAAAMVADGLYTTHGVPVPDYLLALHTAPVGTGLVAARSGTIMAGTDQIDVTFHGVGGHGSMPHLTKDPVVMAAYAVTEYQAIVARVLPPLETGVLTVGSIQAGTDNNVIPSDALVKVNIRYFTPEIRQQMIDAIVAVSNGIATTYGMPPDRLPTIVMKGNSPALVNDAEVVDKLQAPLASLVGDANLVTEFPPATGSEDAHLLRGDNPDVKVAYMAVGIAEPALFQAAVADGRLFPFSAHNPNFVVDLNAIPLGAKVGAVSVFELLSV
jgi:hippurate hydrolase